MLAACPNCGGTADIQGEAIRLGLATCTYCDAFIVVGTSEHPLQKRIEAEKARLKIRRVGDTLSVTGRRPWGGGARLDARELKIGGVFGVMAFFMSVGGAGLGAAVMLGLTVTFFMGIAASFFRFYSPPLVLDAVELKSGLLGADDYRREDIRQLYAVATVIGGGGPRDDGQLHNNICVLGRDGRREVVFGPAKNIEIALAIEQVLEDELGLYNLRVKGDERTAMSTPSRDVRTLREGGSLTCETCGAGFSSGPADWQRGFIHCPYCEHLVGLYEDGGEGVVLGESENRVSLNEVGSLLEIDAAVKAVIDPVSSEIRQGEGASIDTIAFSDIAAVRVRRVGGLQLSGGSGVVQRMKQVQARSGDVSAGEIFGAAFSDMASDSYSVLLQMKEGLDRVLVGNLQSAREALELRGRVSVALGLED